MKIKDFRRAAGLTITELAQILRRYYPGVDKYLVSKIENPERYGIRLTAAAERRLRSLFPGVKTRQDDRHKKRRTVTVCFSEEEFARLQQRIPKGETASGYIIKHMGKEMDE